jgi:toxin ParE1/3/4
MNIRWTKEAVANLERISLYIAEDSFDDALKTVNRIYERIEQLSAFPQRGRVGREPDTRELVLSPLPYIVAYRVKESTVEILHIWHGAQRRR